VNPVFRKNKHNNRPGCKSQVVSMPAIAAFGCFLMLSLHATTAAQATLPPGVNIQLEASPKNATIGDHIRINLDIITPQGYRVEILKPEIQNGDFSILEFSSESKPAKSNGALLYHGAKIIVAIYKTGAFTFPPVRMVLVDSAGNKTEVASPSVNIHIQSVIDKDHALKDLKKQADIPERSRWILWLALVVAGCILILLAWRFWKRKQNRSPAINTSMPVRNPLDVAESELKSLLAQGLPAGGHEKKFYILLSDIVKRILESGLGINAEEQTTSEIMESLSQVPDLSMEKLELIENSLGSCDIVKFAKYIPSKSEHEAAGEGALKILAAARSHQQSVVSRQRV
jgi:hypothetical protein